MRVRTMTSGFPVVNQPAVYSLGLDEPPGATPVNDVIVRCMRDTPEDTELAGRLLVEAFRGKIAFNVSEQK